MKPSEAYSFGLLHTFDYFCNEATTAARRWCATSMMGIDSPEEPMVTDRRGIVLISFLQSIAEPSDQKPVQYEFS